MRWVSQGRGIVPEFGLAPWSADLATQRKLAQQFVAAGGGSVWVSESERSATVQAAALASYTADATVGTCIALAFTRSALITAMVALDLDDLTGGRFVLGLGTGVKTVNERWHGVNFSHPTARLADRIGLIRALMAGMDSGERVRWESEWDDVDVRVTRRTASPRPQVPIFAAGVGPKMLATVGSTADGWLGHELSSPALVRQTVLPGLRDGARTSHRGVDQLTRVAGNCCSVHPDASLARRRAATTVAYYATVRPFTPMFEFHGFGQAARRIQQRFREGTRGSGLLDEVSDEMVRAYTVAGTPDDVRQQLLEWEGVTDILRLHPPRPRLGLDPDETNDAQQRLMEVVL